MKGNSANEIVAVASPSTTTKHSTIRMRKREPATSEMEGTNENIAAVVRSGECFLGIRQTLRTLHRGRAKLVIIASNISTAMRIKLEQSAAIAMVEIQYYAGTNKELGIACGKSFRVSSMSITDAGDSDILGPSSADN
ncbi:60S ribosomal protein L30-like [Drosophila subobscura]|uniref:60S ribosomal protein L30-like n=1 Tax=Drosophila subobscura TaxID=7241 RepID=UPI00155AB446|nr:60S ribosomal protein L30-like [Drosophila subobscura]